MKTAIPRGRVEVTVRNPGGPPLARRTAVNMVVRNGAAVIARLFSGAPGALPVNQIQVGFATDAANPELKALTPPAGNIAAAALVSPLTPANFQVDTTRADSVQVSINAVFHPTVDLDNVTEAGLFAGGELYNQVVFEPLSMKAGQDITFFWQIDFPFGR